jgi:hypothetical protein
VQDDEYQCCMTGINQVLKLSWQITNNSKNLRGHNDNENKMMITTVDEQDYNHYLS